MDELCNEVYIEIINTVLHTTKSYVKTVAAYLIAVYIDTQLGPDTVDVSDEKHKEITDEVMEAINELGLNNSDNARMYIKDTLVKMSNQIELLENQ